MKRIAQWVASLSIIALVAGCAATGGPKYKEMSQGIATPQPGTERIWFYRTTFLGFAVQPDVKLNGEVVGSAVPGGFFYVDRSPSDFTVTTATEVEKKLTFALEQGQPRYVRLDMSMGFFLGHVYAVLVDEEKAKKEMESTTYTVKAAAK
jgi:hypothetical protein